MARARVPFPAAAGPSRAMMKVMSPAPSPARAESSSLRSEGPRGSGVYRFAQTRKMKTLGLRPFGPRTTKSLTSSCHRRHVGGGDVGDLGAEGVHEGNEAREAG